MSSNMQPFLWQHNRSPNGAEGHDSLSRAISSLKKDEWEADTPVCIDGENWTEDVREVATLHMLNAFQRNRTARALIVQNTILDLKTQLALSQVFEHCTQLVSVQVRNVQCSPGQPILPSSLFRNLNLYHLGLEKCTMCNSLCCELAHFVRKSSSLQSLVVKNVTWAGGLSLFNQAIKNNRSLEHLHIQGLEAASEKDVHKLLEALRCNRSIAILELEQMGLGTNHAKRLCNLLIHNPRIIELSLRRNELDASALRIVTHGLVRNNTLQCLWLSHNHVQDAGAQLIVAALQRNKTLRKLCLVDCEITREGCLAIVTALPTFHGLRHLKADMNEMESCVLELEQALQRNSLIEHVLCGLPQLMQEDEEEENEEKAKYLKNWKVIDFFLRANKAKRHALVDPRFPTLMIPRVLECAKDQPDVLYYFVHSIVPKDN